MNRLSLLRAHASGIRRRCRSSSVIPSHMEVPSQAAIQFYSTATSREQIRGFFWELHQKQVLLSKQQVTRFLKVSCDLPILPKVPIR